MNALRSALDAAGILYETDVPLSRHGSFRIGGPGDLGLYPRDRAQLTHALSLLREEEIPVTVIGNGSNVVFPDEGLRGAVIFTEHCRAYSVTDTSVTADAGVTLATLATAARDASLTGLEFAHGIPGTLGGAVLMNAGAYGGCMADICISSDYYDMNTGGIHTLSGDAQGFGTRTSFYAMHPECVVLGATLALSSGDRDAISDTMRELAMRRRASQPLEFPSAGSVFKRPAGYFAGKLIEDQGLKGYRIGGAEVSQKHAGFIINRGDATARDVRELVDHIQNTVFQATGVRLECEIRFL